MIPNQWARPPKKGGIHFSIIKDSCKDHGIDITSKNKLALCYDLYHQLGGNDIIKINDYLYKARKGDVWYVMERIDQFPERVEFWRNFSDTEYKRNHSKYIRIYSKVKLPDKGFLKAETREDKSNLKDGLGAFKDILNEFHGQYQLWIAFVSTQDIDSVEDIKPDDIEMYVTISTTSDAPMVTHMGINRSLGYLVNATIPYMNEDEIKYFMMEDRISLSKPIHPKLAINLHAFAAQVILDQDPKKIYLITSPVENMAMMFVKALPNNVYEGANIEEEKTVRNTPITVSNQQTKFSGGKGEIKIFDKSGNLIYRNDKTNGTIDLPLAGIHLKGEDLKQFDWFNNLAMQQNNYATIDYGVLASLF